MLIIFEDHLKRSAAGRADDFHIQLRKRVGKRATSVLEKRLKNLILLMPKLLSQAHKHCNRNEVPSELKKLIGFTLTYFYHPMDIIPDGKDKLFGYLDDAYFVGLAYEKLLKSIPKNLLSQFDVDFLKNFSSIRRSVKWVIPDEAERISEVFKELLSGKPEAFYAAVA